MNTNATTKCEKRNKAKENVTIRFLFVREGRKGRG